MACNLNRLAKSITLLIGRVLLVLFLFLPTYPGAVTGRDSVSSWIPGCGLFVMEPIGIMLMLGDVASVDRKYAANPDDFQGDGLAVYKRDMILLILQNVLILVGSALMVVCAVWKWQRRGCRLIGSILMLAALGSYIRNFMIESQTYVDGSYHIGIGSYFWVASCLVLILSVNINSEQSCTK
jgi:hypothetical protein